MIISTTTVYGMEDVDSLYKIVKIKTTGDYYVVHAHKNDSLFKIISKKVRLDEKTNLSQLKKGSCYYFDFKKEQNNGTNGKAEPLTGITNYLQVKHSRVFVDGKTRIRFTRRFHFRLYMTGNLIGLYYSGKAACPCPCND